MAVIGAQVKSINRADKTVELEDGRKIPLPDDLAFEFFGSQAAKEKKQGISEAVGTVQQGVSAIPGGESTGAFLSGASEGNPFSKLATNLLDYVPEALSSIKPGEGQEEMNYFQRLGENVEAVRAGRRQGKGKIQEENPKSFLAGEVAGIGSGLVTPLPKVVQGSPVAQSVLMGAGMSDKNVFQDPLGVAKDTAIDAAIGKTFGMAGNKLEKIAEERGALRKYPQLLEAHTQAQTKAEKKFISEMARKLDAVDRDLSAGGIPKGALRVNEFINDSIGLSPLAGTTQGNNLSKFLSGLESAVPDSMKAADLKKVFSSIEGRLATATAEEAPVLNAFRDHLVQSLPIGAAGNAVKDKFGTRIFSSFEKQIDKSVNKFLSDTKMVNDVKNVLGKGSVDNLADDLKRFVKTGFDKINPVEFMEDLKSGNLQDRLMWFFDNEKKLLSLENKLESEIQNIINGAINNKPIASFRGSEVANLIKARDEIQGMRQSLRTNLSNSISSNLTSASIYERDILQKVSSKMANAVGVQNPFSAMKPTNMRPMQSAPPSAPQVGRLAEFFEQPNFYKNNLKKLTNFKGAGGLAKMGYLFKGLPKAGVAAAAGAGVAGLTSALRGVTSPTALGAFARQGIQRGGLRFVVESIADKYPSYERGILTDPQDRRSATAEIEQDQDIGLEDKAVLQARINRGLSIEDLIKE